MEINYDNNFFNDEERDGFFVRSIMKRNWAVQLDVLCMIDDICKRHKITYWVDYGTLLGAIRHNGFIPWDDDIDISMKRVDYERFLGCAYKEIKKPYWVAYLEGHAGAPLRILNRKNITVDETTYSKMHGFPYVSGVDIFPFDNIPNDDAAQKMKDLIVSVLGVSQFWEENEEDGFSDEGKKEAISIIEKATGTNINLDDDVVKQLHYLCDRLSAIYFDEPTEALAYVVDYVLTNKSIYKKEWLEEFIYVPFENILVPVPKEYEKILETNYGNWKIPKKFSAEHDYPFFKDQISLLEKYAKDNDIILNDDLLWK